MPHYNSCGQNEQEPAEKEKPDSDIFGTFCGMFPVENACFLTILYVIMGKL